MSIFGQLSKEYKEWQGYQELLELLRDDDRTSTEEVNGFSIGSSLLFRDRYCDHINQVNSTLKEGELCHILQKVDKHKAPIK